MTPTAIWGMTGRASSTYGSPSGRLRKSLDRSDDGLVAEYTYNGLRDRITEHTDTELGGDVDSNDDILHFMYDARWRLVATFREDDADTDWTAASDGTLEERIYDVQNWRGDVVDLPAGDVDLDGDVNDGINNGAQGGSLTICRQTYRSRDYAFSITTPDPSGGPCVGSCNASELVHSVPAPIRPAPPLFPLTGGGR